MLFQEREKKKLMFLGKLKRCETLIRAKGKKIQEFEERLGKTKPKQLSP